MKFDLIKINSFLLYIFPAALITGPLIPEIILGCVLLTTNYKIVREKKFYYYNNKFFYFCIIFWLYILLNSLISENIFWSLRTSVPYFRYLLFVVSVIYIIKSNSNFLNNFTKVLILTISIVVLDLIFQYIFQKNILGFSGGADLRYSGFFGEELILGSYLLRFLPLLYALGLSQKILISKNKILIPIFLMFLFVIFITGERTSLILYLLFICAATFIISKNLKHRLATITFLFFSFLLILFLNKNFYSRVVENTLIYLAPKNEKKIYIISEIHEGHFVSAYSLFKQKPLVGHGVNSFRKECIIFKHEYSCATHPHNFYLQTLSEIGLLGTFFVLLIFLYFILNLFQKNIEPGIKLVSLGLIIFLWPLAPSGNFFNNWLNMNFYFILSFFIYFKEFKKT